MTDQQSIREERERIVREHMEAENALEMDRALETFAHPRYEIMSTGRVYDGPRRSTATTGSRARRSRTSGTS